MSLKEQLAQDLREAMRSGDEVRKLAIRAATAAIRNGEIADGREYEDADVQRVVQRQVKQRRDSIAEFEKAGRQDLVAKESAELAVLDAYLPQQLSRDQIVAVVQQVIAETGAAGPAAKGKVMPVVIKRLQGQADGREINAVVTELLAQG